MNITLKTGIINILNGIVAHGGEGEFDIEGAKPFAKAFVKQLESLDPTRLETGANPGETVRVFIKTKAGTRDYQYEVDAEGLVTFSGSGFLFAKPGKAVQEEDKAPA